MENIIRRRQTKNDTTFGQWFIDGVFECHTLEDAVREVDGEPVHLWKIDGDTAIPSGRYRLSLEFSPRFGADTITVHDVPGFEGVRVHAGNDAGDTEGCPIVGDHINTAARTISGGAVRGVLKRLKAKIAAAIAAGEDVWLMVQNSESEIVNGE